MLITMEQQEGNNRIRKRVSKMSLLKGGILLKAPYFMNAFDRSIIKMIVFVINVCNRHLATSINAHGCLAVKWLNWRHNYVE